MSDKPDNSLTSPEPERKPPPVPEQFRDETPDDGTQGSKGQGTPQRTQSDTVNS